MEKNISSSQKYGNIIFHFYRIKSLRENDIRKFYLYPRPVIIQLTKLE